MTTYAEKFRRLADGEDVPFNDLVGAAILTGLVDPIEPATAWLDVLRELKRQSSLGPLDDFARFAAWRFGAFADFAMGINLLGTLKDDAAESRPDAGGDQSQVRGDSPRLE